MTNSKNDIPVELLNLKELSYETHVLIDKINNANQFILSAIREKKDKSYEQIKNDLQPLMELAEHSSYFRIHTGVGKTEFYINKNRVGVAKEISSTQYYYLTDVKFNETFEEFKNRCQGNPISDVAPYLIIELMKNWDVAYKNIQQEFAKQFKLKLEEKLKKNIQIQEELIYQFKYAENL